MSIDYKNLQLKELNYNSYLKLPALLTLQQRISEPPHHDEMFFIIIHQAAELWFKEMLHETGILIKAFRDGQVSMLLKVLRRINAILRLQVQQINLLNTLTPVEFGGFRDKLNPASGFQSVQFREMEYWYGLRNPFFQTFFSMMPEVVKELKWIATQPSVCDEFLAFLNRSGYPIPDEVLKRNVGEDRQADPRVVAAIQKIYENPGENYHLVLLFEALLDFDEQFKSWRDVHIQMVARAIGQKRGTGGSTGYDFLKSRAELRFFPELWEVRNVLGGGQSY